MVSVDEKKLVDGFRELGFNWKTARQLAKLVLHLSGEKPLGKWELERWQRLNVLDENGDLIVGEDEDVADSYFWIMIGLTWEGLVKRCVKGG